MVGAGVMVGDGECSDDVGLQVVMYECSGDVGV